MSGEGFKYLDAYDVVGGLGLEMFEPSEADRLRWRVFSPIETLRENPDSMLYHELPSRWQVICLLIGLAGFVAVFVR